jgi:hypothetical protein
MYTIKLSIKEGVAVTIDITSCQIYSDYEAAARAVESLIETLEAHGVTALGEVIGPY